MKLDKTETSKLIDLYIKIQDFLNFLEKEKKENKKEQ